MTVTLYAAAVNKYRAVIFGSKRSKSVYIYFNHTGIFHSVYQFSMFIIENFNFSNR